LPFGTSGSPWPDRASNRHSAAVRFSMTVTRMAWPSGIHAGDTISTRGSDVRARAAVPSALAIQTLSEPLSSLM
jgi:hypothetical protein